jgi:hypothetical protein
MTPLTGCRCGATLFAPRLVDLIGGGTCPRCGAWATFAYRDVEQFTRQLFATATPPLSEASGSVPSEAQEH